MSTYTGLEIAVIGLSGKFPKADNLEQYWQNLVNGRDCISALTDEEILAEGESEKSLKDPSYIKAKAYLDNKEYFDAAFFGYLANEALLMDPQLRIFHECCWAALEDSGYNLDNHKDKIGVFASGSPNLNWEVFSVLKNKAELVDEFTASQLRDVSFLSTRVSYLLNLKGPSVFMQTACSSSLVAVNEACKSLLLGECNMALAGGIRILNHSKKGYFYSPGMVYSKDGRCRPFDEQSSGTVAGEGVGVVVLKRLKDALKDNDNIHAIIKGTSINNDGSRKVGFTAPSTDGQVEVIRKAQLMGKVDPKSITYVEAHGTGTELGDPIEIDALNEAFGYANGHRCAIGSVKSNIGHLDSAAGIAGFIKVVLALKNKTIPGTLHFQKPNPRISFDKGPFYISSIAQPWQTTSGRLRAAISSFGIGGTNAHVVLEEAPLREDTLPGRREQILLLSAKTEKALRRNTAQLIEFLTLNPAVKLDDVAYTLQTGRTRMPFRKAVVAANTNEAIDALGGDESVGQKANIQEGMQNIVFMFSGQGAQYQEMGKDLYVSEPLFRTQMDECFHIAKGFSTADFYSILFSSSTVDKDVINHTQFTQPLLFFIEYTLAKMLMTWGVKPNYMIGHSIGEYVAACVSGVLSLEDAIRLVIRRGALMAEVEPGSMLSVSMTAEQLQPLLAAHKGIDLAVLNGPTSIVVSGSHREIERFEKTIAGHGYQGKRLHTSHAFHSQMMDPVMAGLAEAFEEVTIHAPAIPYVSNLTGDIVGVAEVNDRRYWCRHLREAVQFSKGIDMLVAQGNAIFIEIGPGRTLCNYVSENRSLHEGHKLVNTLRHATQTVGDSRYLAEKLGQLWLYGIDISWSGYHSHQRRNRISLPTYSFERVPYPVHVNAEKMLFEVMSTKTSIAKEKDVSKWIYTPSWSLVVGNNLKVIDDVKVSLIFTNEKGIGYPLADLIRGNGNRVIMVNSGDHFNFLSETDYQINPHKKEDFDALFSALKKGNSLPDRVIYAWNTMSYTGRSEKTSWLTFYTLWYSVCALKHQGGLFNSKLILLTENLYPVLDKGPTCFMESGATGMLKVVAQEDLSVVSVHIDFDPRENALTALAANIYQEINTCATGKTISFRNGQRWELTHSKIATAVDQQENFRKGGTYLITGGLGSFGYYVASYLQLQFQANLILLGREPLVNDNSESINGFRADRFSKLQHQGKVLYFDCSLSDVQAVAAVVETAEEVLGPIHGVFHAAGNISRSIMKPVHELTDDDLQQQFLPKVQGLQTLQQVLGGRNLDFCLITSSLSSVLGGIGYGAYAAANAFMDHFIRDGHSQGLLENWVSVNLDAFDLTSAQPNVINGEEMEEVLNRILSVKHIPQLAVSVSSLYERLDKWVYKIGIEKASDRVTFSEDADKMPTQHDPSSHENDFSQTQKHLIALWRNFFSRSDINLDDDFFEIGGDSLKALTIIGRIHKMLDIDMPIADFFKTPSIRQLSEYVDRRTAEVKQQNGYAVVPKTKHQAYYRLSSVQRRLYFLYEFDRQSLAYILTKFIKLKGTLDRARLNDAFQQLVNRHESLRTSFEIVEGEPVQKIMDYVPFTIDYYKVDEMRLNTVITNFLKPFDLSQGNLIKVGLAETASDEYTLMLSMHHIITDGVSRAVLIKDLMELYSGATLSEPRLQYKDYSEWQQSDVHKKEFERQREFWLQEFAEMPEALNLPLDFKRPLVRSFGGDTISFEVSSLITARLNDIAITQGASLYMIMLALFKVFLHKISHQNDILVGTVTSGRQHADLEDIVGMFVNTLVVRSRLEDELTFMQFLQKVKEKVLTVLDNQDYQYEDLLNDLKPEKDTSRNPLFDVMFSFENEVSSNLQIAGLEVEAYDITLKLSQFDFKIRLMQTGGKLACAFEYVTALFKTETVHRFITYFQNVITAVASDPAIKISSIEIITPEEKTQILSTFNNTDLHFDKQKTLIDLFEESVRQYPLNTAVIADGVFHSYQSINSMVNEVAHLLRQRGVARENAVVVVMERRVELIIAILGILKAGGKYVPVEPTVPDNRMIDIARSVEAMIIISNKTYYETISVLKREVDTIETTFLMDSDDTGELHLVEWCDHALSVVALDDYPSINPDVVNSSEDLAYVIFTSGSTGKPKGVAVQHKPVINLIEWLNRIHAIDSADKVLMVSSISFDLSVYDMFGFFAAGGTVRLANREELAEPGILADIIVQEGITLWDSAPAMLQQVIPFLEQRKSIIAQIARLRLCFLSGDWIPLAMPKQMKSVFANLKFVAMGGATEATVWSNYYIVEEVHPTWNSIPYGKPMQNARYLVLDKGRNLCPVGIPGDLYIGGVCLAAGYFNDSVLTNKKFIASPFYEGERLYDTGDMAKWFPDGNLEFLGRRDSQVKIRGYRIELGEIESQLLKFPGIDSVLADVIVRNKYDKALCIYYISQNAFAESVLKEFLSQTLPAYMIPQFFVHLNAMPMTKNGKLDRKSLPAPQLSDMHRIVKVPVNEIQEFVRDVWAQLLQLPEHEISITHDFFECGGHSIMAVNLVNLIQKKYQIKLKLREVFTHATIEKLASLITSQKHHDDKAIPHAGDMDYYVTSSAQQRLYFEQLLNPDNLEYNITGAYQLGGDVDTGKLTRALQSLVKRHESLRTSFIFKDGSVVQQICNDVDFKVALLDGNDYDSFDGLISSFKKSFNLSDNCLFRCALVNFESHALLLTDIHHIVCDGISMNILIHDLGCFYNGIELMPLPLRYVDYALWQKNNHSTFDNQKKYWQNQLSGELPWLNLPVVQERSSTMSNGASVSTMLIDDLLKERIGGVIKDAGVSAFMFFLSAYYLLLYKISGNRDIIIASDVIGRPSLLLNNIVGTFINLLPLRLKVDEEIPYRAFLEQVKNVVLTGFENQDFQFDEMISMLRLPTEEPENRIAQVHFAFANYVNKNGYSVGLTPLDVTQAMSSNFEFKVEVREHDQGYKVLFIYNDSLYDTDTIEFLKKHYLNIVKSIALGNEVKVKNIVMRGVELLQE